MKKYILLSAAVVSLFSACKPDEEPVDQDALQASIINDFSTQVAQPAYYNLSSLTAQLYTATVTLQGNPTDANLTACRNLWKDSRSVWEKTEGFLFGPVATENIDPRIDTWPVNFADLDSVLASSATFDATYINGLEDALRGFHPIEYLLWGQNGNKAGADFTTRQLDYLVALALNLKNLTGQLYTSWDPSANGNYHAEFTTAGTGSALYPTKRSAFEELVNSMAGICDEVANGKMSEPFTLQDASLEESPFAGNSITDFTNNIRGVEAVYLGKLNADGRGIEDFVREHNLSLDGKIKTDIATAIAALGAINGTFGQAIFSEPVQVQNAIDKINVLKATLEDELLPLVQQHTN